MSNNTGANLGFEDKPGFCKSAALYEQMRESIELDAVIRKNLEMLGYGE